MAPEISKLVHGKRKEIKIEGDGIQSLTFRFTGDPKVASKPHLILSTTNGQTLHAVPERNMIAFKGPDGSPIKGDGVLGPKGEELRIKISQLWEFIQNLSQKLTTSTLIKVVVIAVLTLLAAKIGILLLSFVIAVAIIVLFVATIIALFKHGIGGLRYIGREVRNILKEAGIEEKNIDNFLKKTSTVAQQVLATVIAELRKLPQFAQ